MPRGVVYTVFTSHGQKRIVIDLIRQNDIGENQARNNFINDGLANGYTLITQVISRREID